MVLFSSQEVTAQRGFRVPIRTCYLRNKYSIVASWSSRVGWCCCAAQRELPAHTRRCTVDGIMKRSVVVAALLLCSTAAAGADLDAPATPTRPTTRSELVRGHEMASACSRSSIKGYADDHQKLSDCVDGAEHREIQNKTSTDAYLAGLYFATCVFLEIVEPRFRNRVFRAEEDLFFSQLEAKKKALKLTDQQIAEAIGMKPDVAAATLAKRGK
jgi:hypothetical protein